MITLTYSHVVCKLSTQTNAYYHHEGDYHRGYSSWE